MPTLTFPLALALTTCFVVGSLVTWVLQERRRRMERDELERQMTRALQTRYEVYEGLEQTVVKLITKFDAMESEFRERLTKSAQPRNVADKTVRLRSSNPELWDIEREHHRVTSEQLAEIARRSSRITELMEQIQKLEPAQTKLENELSALKHRYDNAVANAAEFEQASNLKVERLQARVGELEPLGSLLEAARRELAQTRTERDSAVQAGAARVAELQARSEELNEVQERAQALEAELAQAQSNLASLKTSHDNVWGELETAKKDLAQSVQRCDVYTADLVKARQALDDSHVQLQSAQQLAESRGASVTKLESELAAARGELQAQQAGFEQSTQSLRDEALAAQTRAASLQTTLDETVAAHASEQAASNERVASLSKELEVARAELTLHRAKLAAHSSHVVEAWSVLSELKPMLETLEQKLKETDEPSAALPATNPAATGVEKLG